MSMASFEKPETQSASLPQGGHKLSQALYTHLVCWYTKRGMPGMCLQVESLIMWNNVRRCGGNTVQTVSTVF